MDNILSIKDLNVYVMSARGIVHAVRGISLDLKKGAIHGFVGESGCGKSMTAKSILRLHDADRAECTGEILYNGDTDILKMKKKELQQLRGKEISMIFQDPMVSLNTLFTVGEQISEMLRRHFNMSHKAAEARSMELLELVGINPPEKRYGQYPFEFSGGMLQRIMIAIGVACNPKVLIADEPTTALDVTIQAQILELLKRLQQQLGMTIFFITHNFGVVAEICDTVSVMYAGRIVETSDVRTIFKHPSHPYTRALIESIPKTGQHGKRLVTISGNPPELFDRIGGCAFAPRCQYATEKCFREPPALVPAQDGHYAACHYSL